MIKGSERILYILTEIDGFREYYPLACLTSNTFSEKLDTLDTTTRQTGGWKTSRGVSQSFTVDFEGLIVYNPVNKISYNDLKKIKRRRALMRFKIENLDGSSSEVFRGFITDLSESAVTSEFVSFNGSILGFGEPTTYEDGIPITFDSTVVTFDSTNITFDNTVE